VEVPTVWGWELITSVFRNIIRQTHDGRAQQFIAKYSRLGVASYTPLVAAQFVCWCERKDQDSLHAHERRLAGFGHSMDPALGEVSADVAAGSILPTPTLLCVSDGYSRTVTAFTSVYSSNASWPISRPHPDCL
jgi:hypothetical protein